MSKITLSVLKADIGGYVGHSSSHPEVMAKAEALLDAAKRDGKLVDFSVLACGDDLQLIMTHN
ncbi:fructose 1,6-bisphosphatase, partial [candidate division WOR-3 bacterium]|nr:fructose 1,6-bisphosphatase [candidate division WOR-3 bacterium]